MDKIKQQFNIELIERIGSIKFNSFKQNRADIYEACLSTIKSINYDRFRGDNLTLIKDSISPLRIKVDDSKVFIFCGCYMLKGKKTLLLENIHTIGTYFLQDATVVRKLEMLKIGIKVRLKRVSNETQGVEIELPYEKDNLGLFEH